MKVRWVKDYTKEECKHEIDETSLKDIVFLQMGPSLPLLRYLRSNNFRIWILNTEQFSRYNRISRLKKIGKQPYSSFLNSQNELSSESEEGESERRIQNNKNDEVAFDFDEYIFNYLKEGVNLIDYSQSNLDYLNLIFDDTGNQRAFQTRLKCFIPQITCPYSLYNNPECSRGKEKKNVVFVGDCNSTYRRAILSQLDDTVTQLTNVFGAERDRQIFAHDILINIHFTSNYTVFEEIRCLPCVLAKMIVVSETADLDKDHPIFPFIIFVPYSGLVNAIGVVRKNYSQLHAKMFENNPKFNSLRKDIYLYECKKNQQHGSEETKDMEK